MSPENSICQFEAGPEQQLFISPDDIALPMAILSMDDGLIVYINDAFRKSIKSAVVGKPLNRFLDDATSRARIANQLKQKTKCVTTLQIGSRKISITISIGQFLNLPHYFVFVVQQTSSFNDEQFPVPRSVFTEQLSLLLATLTPGNQQQHTMCIIDVDHFKIINEKYGYVAGDYVLNELAEMIRKYVDMPHYLGRLGSNEFGLILKNTEIETAVNVCEKINDYVRHHNFQYCDTVIPVTLSIGVTSINSEVTNIDQLFAQGALALSSARENGRDRVHSTSSNDTMMAYHSDRMQYALIIEDALLNDKFELFVQPIVLLNNPDVHYSYEILIRIYDHKNEAYVSPQDLIAAAESLEITTRIDKWVCKKVFEQFAGRHQSDLSLPYVSINLSAHSIVDSSFEKFLIELGDKYQVPPNCICFEITESVAVKSINRARNFIRNLRAIGYRFSLDDFGVGYCSFNYLNQLEVDNVKIDGSFVTAMLDDATQFATVQAITNVARTMNIKTVAEFVDKPEIIKALKVIGVDYGQGYIFSRPFALTDLFGQSNQSSP